MKIYTDASRLPSHLLIARHGESAGNVARAAALQSGAHRIAIEGRDVDVPLSALGEQQARALARWLTAEGKTPEVIVSSPCRRARDTASLIMSTPGITAADGIVVDERLREKEFGILDGLTQTGIAAVYPEQAKHRALLGKFYHRPPGGESWCDVILRLRSMLDTLSLHYAGKRVLIVTHQVVVLCLRYLLEGMDEAGILAIDGEGDVANCAITEYRRRVQGDTSEFVLECYNCTTPLIDEDIPVTAAPDRKAVGA